MRAESAPSLLDWKNNAEFATADESGRLLFWDIDHEAQTREVAAFEGPINSLCFDPSGTLLAAAS